MFITKTSRAFCHHQYPAIMLKKLFYFIIPVVVLYTSCTPRTTPGSDNKVLTVTILPQKYVVSQIAGDKFSINVLIPEEGNHETYEPTAQQMVETSKSVIYFKVGHLGVEESWLSKLAESNPDMKIYNTAEGFELIEGVPHVHGDHVHAGGIDPHTWLSVSGVRAQAGVVLKALQEIDPEHAAYFQSNYSGFMASLDTLDSRISKLISLSGVTSFMIYHPSLGYFARDYQLEQIAIEQDGKEPSPAAMKELADLAAEKKISTIFISSQFSKQSALTIADQINAKVVEFNPSSADWSNNMLQIAQKLDDSNSEK